MKNGCIRPIGIMLASPKTTRNFFTSLTVKLTGLNR